MYIHANCNNDVFHVWVYLTVFETFSSRLQTITALQSFYFYTDCEIKTTGRRENF